MFSFEQIYNVSVVIEDLELINSAKLTSEEMVWNLGALQQGLF
jgi:hypothetical protein